MRICEAKFGILLLFEGDDLALGCACTALPPNTMSTAAKPLTPTRSEAQLRARREDRTSVHIRATSQARRPHMRGTADIVTARGDTLDCVVPMLKDNELIGAIGIYRQEVRPFTEKQIELVQISPHRPSSPSRTPACSTSCANRCSSRPRPPTCSRSSVVRPSICRRCSIRSSSRRPGFARRICAAIASSARAMRIRCGRQLRPFAGIRSNHASTSHRTGPGDRSLGEPCWKVSAVQIR